MKVLLLALTIAIPINNAVAFLNTISSSSINYRPHHTCSWKTNKDTKCDSHTMMLPISPIFDVTVAETMQNAAILVSSEQNHEAQFYGDLAHLILDFLTFCTADGIAIRLLIFLGRICSILSDYVPDHQMTYDELVFQSTMLTTSISMLLKKVSTTVSSLDATTSFKDKRIYKVMFSPAGFTWIQYKTLLSTSALQWVYYDPGMRIDHDYSLLITYKGEIEQVNGGSKFVERYGVIGDLSQVPQFSESSLDRRKSLKDVDNRKNDYKNQQGQDHERILRAGKEGLTLLQIDMKKLFEHGSEDEKISESTKNFYFNAIQNVLILYSEESPFLSSFSLHGNKRKRESL